MIQQQKVVSSCCMQLTFSRRQQFVLTFCQPPKLANLINRFRKGHLISLLSHATILAINWHGNSVARERESKTATLKIPADMKRARGHKNKLKLSFISSALFPRILVFIFISPNKNSFHVRLIQKLHACNSSCGELRSEAHVGSRSRKISEIESLCLYHPSEWLLSCARTRLHILTCVISLNLL